jgi:hypothetical protein
MILEAILKMNPLPDIDAFGQPVQIRIALFDFIQALCFCHHA